MNQLFLSGCFFLISLVLFAQKDLTPGGKKSSYFGKVDLKEYRFYGLQISAGPTFLKTRAENPTTLTSNAIGRPIDYTIDPLGRIGFFAEAGLAHFTQRRSRLARALKKEFISYYDYGIGFKYFSGNEVTTVRSYAQDGTLSNTTIGSGAMKNGYVYGRFSIHKNFYFAGKYFLDNGLGINMDYRLIEGLRSYSVGGIVNNYNHDKVVAQLNYDLGFGIKLSRRSFLIPGVHLPIVGFNEWRGGCAALKWFDSNYLPIMAKVKVIYLFEKKVTGCNTPASKDDRKRNEEYLQNN